MLAGKIGYFRATLDPDAAAYLAAVEAADGQALEAAVRTAVNNFVVGCKADGIWTAIKASCILMGARTLSGCLVPLAGTAPTNVNFVSGDYNRKTGPQGDATKYINTNRNRQADGQNDSHYSVFTTALGTNSFGRAIGVGSGTGRSHFLRSSNTTDSIFSHNTSGDTTVNTGGPLNFCGVTRSASSSYSYRINGTAGSVTATSQASPNLNWFVYNANPLSTYWNLGRIAFYSIGSAVNLSSLNSRVSALHAAIGAAIP